MQQQFMQMQPMMAAAYNPYTLTTDHIQQYLDENRYLIMKIIENQNIGKASERDLAKLQQNLMYLETVSGSPQLQQPTMNAQFLNAVQQGAHFMQHQQAPAMTPELLMAARSSTRYYHQPMSATQQQQAMRSQLGMNSGGNYYGLPMMHSEGMRGGMGSMGGVFPDLSGVRRYPQTSTLNKLCNDNKGMECEDMGETNATSLKDSAKATKAKMEK